MRRLALLVLAGMAFGCRNPYVETYRPVYTGFDLQDPSRFIQATDLDVKYGDDPAKDSASMKASGWELLGFSQFAGTEMVNRNQVLTQVKNCGATCIVIYTPSYKDAKTGETKGMGAPPTGTPFPFLLSQLHEGNYLVTYWKKRAIA